MSKSLSGIDGSLEKEGQVRNSFHIFLSWSDEFFLQVIDVIDSVLAEYV